MSDRGSDRSIKARDVTGSSLVTGDNNTVSTMMTQHTLPAPETVDVKAELAALRDLLSKLNVPDRGKLDRAMQDAVEEAAKAKPDEEEVAGAVGRVAKYAKEADDFSEHAEKLLPRLAALGSWLGTYGSPLLALAGIST